MADKKGRFYYRAQFDVDKATGELKLPGSDGRVSGSVPAYHRRNVDYSPYCIPNELICGKIGAFIGLPVPPFSITYFDEDVYFSELNFNPNDANLKPINPATCAAKRPKLCTGILLFDILVANEDRHDANLAADSVANPRQIIVYDHEQALFGGGGNLIGANRLTALRERLGITGGPVTGGNECCLLQSLNTVEYFDEWRLRIWDIPDWFIHDVCDDVVKLGVTRQEADAARNFLIYRKTYLTRIIKKNAAVAPLLSKWRPPHDFFGPR